jgi:hypothetical protein
MLTCEGREIGNKMMTVTMTEFAERIDAYARNEYGYGVVILGHPSANSVRVAIQIEDDDGLGGESVITDIGEFNGRCMVEVKDPDSEFAGVQISATPAAVFAVMYA